MKKLVLSFLLIFLFAACGVKRIEDERFLFGTIIKILVYDRDVEKSQKAINLAFEEIERIDKQINNKSFESDYYRLNNSNGKYVKVSKESIELIKEAMRVSKISDGRYNILVGDLIELWEKNKFEKTIPEDFEIKKRIKKYSNKNIWIKDSKVKLRKGIKIEAGSFLKGYAIKNAKEILEKEGIESGFISAISSIETIKRKANGSKWKVGVQNPKETMEILKTLNLEGDAMGVSGDYQNYYEYNGKRYHHIINAKTGYPDEKNRMVVVVAKNSYIADLMSTVFFVLDPSMALEIADKNDEIEIMIIDREMKEYYSKNFEKYLKER